MFVCYSCVPYINIILSVLYATFILISISGRMKASLALLSYYKECVHNIRDSLGVGAHGMSHYPSMSSIAPADSPMKG